MKNKTLATYLSLLLGTWGAHRFYLKGLADKWGWLHILASSIGLYGMRRMVVLGQDDRFAWALMPLFGASLAVACLSSIVFGLMDKTKWNANYNPAAASDAAAGDSSGLGIFAVIVALLIGATALMSVIAFTGQRYFESVLKTV
ncbi:MAG: hypothetical protein QM533_00080 [Cytophagales bacterium]|nr:hypothetical protein [Cytophagales bacterium]